MRALFLRPALSPALFLAMAAGLSATPAMAHQASLVAATPAANATASGVRTLSLRFSEAVVEKQSGAQIAMTGMPGMANHKPMAVSGFTTTLAADGKTLVLTLPRALPVGTYSLAWHATTDDGHRSEGRYSFTTR